MLSVSLRGNSDSGCSHCPMPLLLCQEYRFCRRTPFGGSEDRFRSERKLDLAGRSARRQPSHIPSGWAGNGARTRLRAVLITDFRLSSGSLPRHPAGRNGLRCVLARSWRDGCLFRWLVQNPNARASKPLVNLAGYRDHCTARFSPRPPDRKSKFALPSLHGSYPASNVNSNFLP